jgi:Na+-driven multidrug efflux pump
LVFVIVPATNLPFPIAYVIFFLSDLTKVFVFEILFHKLNWGKNLTLETKDPETISEEAQKING